MVWAITDTDYFFEDGQLLIRAGEAGLVTLGKLFAPGSPTPKMRGACQPVPLVSGSRRHACRLSIPTHIYYAKRQMMHGYQTLPLAEGLALAWFPSATSPALPTRCLQAKAGPLVVLPTGTILVC